MMTPKIHSTDKIKMKNNRKDATLVEALSAMKALQASARENGIADMSLNEINAEIAAYRKEKESAKINKGGRLCYYLKVKNGIMP